MGRLSQVSAPAVGVFHFPAAAVVLLFGLAAAALLATAEHALAHHSFAAEFSYELYGAKRGEVVEVHYVNPHTRVFVAVTNDDGEEEIWDAQTHAINILLRAGWMRDSVRVGDQVEIEGYFGLENSRKLWIDTITLEDGTGFAVGAGN